MEWKVFDPEWDWDHRPGRMLILVEGWKSHSGAMWNRVWCDIAQIDPAGPHGFRREDIERIRRDGDMDGTERVLAWMSLRDLPPFPRN